MSKKRRLASKRLRLRKRRIQRNKKLYLFGFKLVIISIFLYAILSTGLKYIQNRNIVSTYTPEETKKTTTDDTTEKEIHKFTVFIDPGHGFSDPGTESPKSIGYEIVESKITLDIALTLAKLLEEKDLNVILSRTTDYTDEERKKKEWNKLGYKERTKLANDSNADIFISLHINAFDGSSEVNGYDIFYCDSNNSNNDDKKFLAESIMNSFKTATNIEKIKINTMEKDDSYYVVKHTDMPSILFELGFCTNKQDATRLANEEWRNTVAKSISDGIIKYVDRKNQI